jgi:uracil-DNA glycosylase
MLTTATSSFRGKRLLILGEAPGEEEEKLQAPFVGPSGHFLRTDLLPAAGLDISQFTIANVLQTRPPRNDVKALTLPKTELRKQGLPILGAPLFRRHFLPEPYYEAMETLAWIKSQDFDFILAFGGTALWLLTGDNRIGTFRGTILPCPDPLPLAIATYHPSAVLREYKMRPIVCADLIKARRFLEGTLTPPLERTFVYSPTWEEMEEALKVFADAPDDLIGVDIETAPALAQITTISFATPTYGICIPIWDKHAPAATRNVYPDAREEVRAWRMIDRFAQLPNPKVLQNGLYDMQYLLDAAPFPIVLRHAREDTNILHHALQPELPKDLGTLASLYLNEPGWKQMRTKHDSEDKAED